MMNIDTGKSVSRLVWGAIAALLAVLPGAVSGQSFTYSGETGPQFWGELTDEWEACGTGAIQSPVKVTHFKQLHPKQVSIEYGASTGKIFNNGHTIEVEVDSGSNVLVLNGKRFDLMQFHFHTPSEHRVGKPVEAGRGYDMELHLVHTAADSTNAVIAVYLTRGDSSGALEPILALLPELDVPDPGFKYEVPDFNPATFLPRSGRHARYVGSLTTPPCTEGVEWIVFEEPMTVSDEDMAEFAERIPFNARFVQRQL